MFYPFRTEVDLSLNNSYMNTLYEPGVIDIFNTNKQKFEPYAQLVDTAFFIVFLMFFELQFERKIYNLHLMQTFVGN